MASNSIAIKYDSLRSINSAAILANYALVGTVFDNPPRSLKITNQTSANVLVSFDGSTDNDIVPANSSQIFDYASNKSNKVGDLVQSVGEGVYVKHDGVAPAAGTKLYVTVLYA